MLGVLHVFVGSKTSIKEKKGINWNGLSVGDYNDSAGSVSDRGIMGNQDITMHKCLIMDPGTNSNGTGKALNDYMYLGNSGLLSIVYMIDCFKPKRVLLFGFNFYQSNMINNYFSNSINEDLNILRRMGKKLIQNFLKLCNSFNKIEFQRFDDNNIDNVHNLIQIKTKL